MHDPHAMRGGQASGHLAHDRQERGGGHPSIPMEPGGQGLAVQQLHREEHDLVVRPVSACSRVSVAEDVVDTADVRMCHLSRQVHLALEPHNRALVVGDVRQNRLERDALAQFEILGRVELAHSPFRQVAHDAEAEGDDIAG